MSKEIELIDLIDSDSDDNGRQSSQPISQTVISRAEDIKIEEREEQAMACDQRVPSLATDPYEGSVASTSRGSNQTTSQTNSQTFLFYFINK